MDKTKYKWAVECDDGTPEAPLHTTCTVTREHAERVRQGQRFFGKTLNVVIRPIEEMRGLNPYYADMGLSFF